MTTRRLGNQLVIGPRPGPADVVKERLLRAKKDGHRRAKAQTITPSPVRPQGVAIQEPTNPARESEPSDDTQSDIQQALEDSLDTRGPKRAAGLEIAPRVAVTIQLLQLLQRSETITDHNELTLNIGAANTADESSFTFPEDTVIIRPYLASDDQGNIARIAGHVQFEADREVNVATWAGNQVTALQGHPGNLLENQNEPIGPTLVPEGSEMVLSMNTNANGGAFARVVWLQHQTDRGLPIPQGN